MPLGNEGRWWSRLTNRLRPRWPWRRSRQPEASSVADADRRLVLSLSPSRIPTSRQFRHVTAVLTGRERSTIQWLSFIAIIAAVAFVISYTSRHIAFTPRSGGVLTEGLVGPPEHINPVLARPNTTDADLTHLVFRGLMVMDQDFHLTPDLAEKIDVSADGKEYVIHLRPNSRWSDGTPLKASDVVYTFTTLADPEFKSPLQPLFHTVTIDKRDDRTVVFHLSEPLAPFLSYLTVGIIPEAAWIDASPQAFSLSELNLKPISNGPFSFQSLTKDREGNIKSMQFIRNPYFRGHRPYLDKVVVKFYPDHATAVEALRHEAIDALGNIDLAEVNSLQQGRMLSTFYVSQLTAVFINQKTNGALRSKEIRLALSHATDREAIVAEAVKGYGRPIIGPILPGYLGYNRDLKRYEFDLAKANLILEDAGWKRTESGVRQKGSQQLTFTFTVVDQPVAVAVANQLIANWQKIGAQVELKKIEPVRVQRDVLRPRNYEALLFGQIFNTDPDPYPFWHSSQQRETGFNLSIFFNKKMDQDLELGRRATNNAERDTDYFDFQNILAEEVPAIFLYQHQYLYLHDRHLRGFDARQLVTGTDRFLHSDSWYVKTWPSWVAKKK